jgi:hypothetical protein
MVYYSLTNQIDFINKHADHIPTLRHGCCDNRAHYDEYYWGFIMNSDNHFSYVLILV